MKVLEVNSTKREACFFNVPRKIYMNEPNWVCPFDAEIKDIFTLGKNKKLDFGEAQRWILTTDSGSLLGRIAVFYDKRRAFKEKPFSGGVGFFECINDFSAARLLFDKARLWLTERGMEAMDGPVNFGENFVNQGLLVKGFIQQGYGMPYNHNYYKNLFEQYGFKSYYEMYSYHSDLSKPYPERYVKFARHIGKKEEYHFEHFQFKNYQKYLNDIVEIYNAVWSDFHDDYIPLEYDEIEKMMIEAKPVLNEKFIWFAYDKDKPVGMTIVFPDVNQIMIKLNGKLDFWGKLRFVLAKTTTKISRGRLLITGVIPEYQRTGIIGALFLEMTDELKRNNIKELELSWVGEYNKTVQKIYRQMGAEHAKTHITYRFLFDQTIEFKRFMVDK